MAYGGLAQKPDLIYINKAALYSSNICGQTGTCKVIEGSKVCISDIQIVLVLIL